MSPYRFILEQLAIRDVFGCMTTELAPSILRDAFTPWFFEAEGWSRNGVEWESVERMFGERMNKDVSHTRHLARHG
jgi:hypothetical protein